MRELTFAAMVLMTVTSCSSAPFDYRSRAISSHRAPADADSAIVSPIAKRARLPNLAEVELPAGDSEVRFWLVLNTEAVGVVLRRQAGVFHGLVVTTRGARRVQPVGGWDALWAELLREKLLTLPDDSTLPHDHGVFDGYGYFVELSTDSQRRSYRYSNPDSYAWPEATHILRIASALSRAFRVDLVLSKS